MSIAVLMKQFCRSKDLQFGSDVLVDDSDCRICLYVRVYVHVKLSTNAAFLYSESLWWNDCALLDLCDIEKGRLWPFDGSRSQPVIVSFGRKPRSHSKTTH